MSQCEILDHQTNHIPAENSLCVNVSFKREAQINSSYFPHHAFTIIFYLRSIEQKLDNFQQSKFWPRDPDVFVDVTARGYLEKHVLSTHGTVQPCDAHFI